ncbi:thiolase C-terminal domain-containing protein [Gryllotalpicola koreensis]|uniref:Thiolase n=1 Tax=Gryllotalpicola koreensis TaxID=993086 RepID=A0ABP7ZYH3_9MICO
MTATSMHGGNIAIVGASETDRIGALPDVSMIHLHTNAARRAIADAGIDKSEIDGVATAGPTPIEVADQLGIRPRWVDGTMIGGCSFIALVRHAAAAIAAGAASVVLITHGESGRSHVGTPAYAGAPSSPAGQFEQPFGALAPYSSFTTPVLAFLKERGFTREDLAEVVVSQRLWAIPNERALRRDPIDVEGVLAAPPVAYPFTRDMCCVVTDAGGALVVTSAERARDLPSAVRAVYLLGSGEGTESVIVSQMDELDSFGPFRRGAQEAFQTAELSHDDIDHVMFYDAFAHLPLYMLEDTGFVGKGESAAFYKEGHTRPGGDLPINTQGGGLSYTHSGMYGMFAIQEAVRQLRGEAVVQVPDVKTSFVQGVGFMFGAGATVILTNRAA